MELWEVMSCISWAVHGVNLGNERASGQTRNRTLMKKMGADKEGNVSLMKFVNHFDSTLSQDKTVFASTIDEFIRCANKCRASVQSATEMGSTENEDNEDEGVMPGFRFTQPCHEFAAGKCTFGDKCIFLHGNAPAAGSPFSPKSQRKERKTLKKEAQEQAQLLASEYAELQIELDTFGHEKEQVSELLAAVRRELSEEVVKKVEAEENARQLAEQLEGLKRDLAMAHGTHQGLIDANEMLKQEGQG